MEPQPVPPLPAFQGHSNEEASQAGLVARRARSLRRPPADKDPRRTAINPFNNVEIIDLGQARRFTGPDAGCLRGASHDSGRLRGEAAASFRDDGVFAVYGVWWRWDVTGMPRRSTLTLYGPGGGRARGLRARRHRLGPCVGRLRGACLPLGPQGLRRPKPGGWRAAPRHPRHPRRDHRNSGAQSAQPRSSTASSGARNRARSCPRPAPPSPTSPSAT